jgi:uncharacterized protein
MDEGIISIQEIERLHHKYAPNDKVYNLVYGHCQIVCEIALWCVDNIKDETTVDVPLLRAAALLHDIGTYILFDDEGKVANNRMYPQHAILGAKIVADEGIDMRISKIIETHVLLGLTKQEIIDNPWILPARDYEPDTIEGELLCYADRFHSKHPAFNAYDTFLQGLKKSLPLQAAKFEAWSKRFGIPDIDALAKKYNQTVR